MSMDHESLVRSVLHINADQYRWLDALYESSRASFNADVLVSVVAQLDAEHPRYNSTEFDYSGCSTCDGNGNTLGWPCTTRRITEQLRALIVTDGEATT